MCLIVHACDISHPAKPWELHERWTYQVIIDRSNRINQSISDSIIFKLAEEFFRQGDKEAELGLPYSPLCDRKTTHVAESQVGESPTV